MPRGLSSAAKGYTGPVLWLADITTRSSAVHRFAQDLLTFAGNAYLPYLRVVAGPRFTRTLKADHGEIELINTDQPIRLLINEPLEGALCELRLLQLGLGAAYLVLRGRLTEEEESDAALRFRLVSELDPAQIRVPERDYKQVCSWMFSRPDRLTPCGYNPSLPGDVTEALAERAADIFSPTTIGDSTLSMTPNAHSNQFAVLTHGSGAGQVRRIVSNTATTLAVDFPWETTPDATTRFKVFAFPNGAPRLLKQPGSGVLEVQATAATARSVTASGLAMTDDEHQGQTLLLVSGAGAGQWRKIGANTATQISLHDSEPDFSPAPDASTLFRVLFRTCPKDYSPSCEERARVHAFNAFPLLTPELTRAFGGVFSPGGTGGSSGGGITHDPPGVLL